MMMMKRRGVFVRGDGICTAPHAAKRTKVFFDVWLDVSYHAAKGWMDDEEERFWQLQVFGESRTDRQKVGR